jgi:ABC-type sugar transport system substrate-binding protein
MKSSLKVMVVLLCLALAFSFAACGGGGSDEAATDESAPAATEESEPAATEESATEEAAPAAEPVRVGFIPSDLAGFFAQLKTGLEKWAGEHNVELTTTDCIDTAKKIDAIKNFANSEYNVIICHVDNAEAIKPVMEEVQAKGIKFFAYDTDIEGADAYFGADNFKMGQIIGTMLADWVNATFDPSEKVQAGILNYDPFPFLKTRGEGIVDAIKTKAPNVEIVDSQQGGLEDEGTSVGNAWFTKYPDMKAVAGINDAGCYGLYQAWKSKDKKDQDKVGIFGVDANAPALQAIEEGGMYRGTGWLDADTITKYMTEYAVEIVKNGSLAQREYLFVPTPVTAENVAQYITE